MNTKQIIVARRDLKMPAGKLAAQVAHASMAFLTRRIDPYITDELGRTVCDTDDVEQDWLAHSFTKIVLGCDHESDLMALLERAERAKVEAHLITDNGRTVFGGVPTRTCLAIGPDLCDVIDRLTGHLKLY